MESLMIELTSIDFPETLNTASLIISLIGLSLTSALILNPLPIVIILFCASTGNDHTTPHFKSFFASACVSTSDILRPKSWKNFKSTTFSDSWNSHCL
ncbi:hypothetical protein WICPIJ_008502 [Wickerhamomyces pijperi]|uniref:Uncharacterized protein n=1 Tax=Wickerhamomyces pijperi TaxID=599730 RepID=A0A9P8PYD1_WICPI|nr:hypothetical protein WICPIJ_008502 [Wickerhamomyces pijperi]